MNAKQQFALLDQAWQSVVDAHTLFHSDYQLGNICVRISSPHCGFSQNMTRAFAHLKIPLCDAPDLIICLWDTSATQVKLPPLDWGRLLYHEYQGYQDEGIYFHFFKHIEALSCVDAAAGQAYYIVRDQTQLPWWVAGSPFVIILNQVLQQHGFQLTHTAAVGNEHQAVLLTGKSGSGKSTTSLACAKSGLYVIGEDYCILQSTESACVYSIYQSAKWTTKTCELFPEYQRFIVNKTREASEKSLVYYNDFIARQVKLLLPVHTVISLQVNPTGETQIFPQSPAEGIKHLMLSTLAQLPGSNNKTLEYFMLLSKKFSFYQLLLGKEHAQNVAVIRSFLQ